MEINNCFRNQVDCFLPKFNHPTSSSIPTTRTPSPSRISRDLRGDRYIPNRQTTDTELAHHQIIKHNNSMANADGNEAVRVQLNSEQSGRILSYNSKIPECTTSNLSVFTYQKNVIPKLVRRHARYIPNEPVRILDAPEVLNDYYLNLLDWNSNNLVAVGLGSAVYIWNASNGSISKLLECPNNNYPSSLRWARSSPKYLAVGTTQNEVQIWDTNTLQLCRTMLGHTFRVAALDWNFHMLTSGSRNGAIIHHDPRIPDHFLYVLTKHSEEVCGLKWSPDGGLLASGSNDNQLCIWDQKQLSTSKPLHASGLHLAAVKALSWCPWSTILLASGGGTADGQLRIWNAQSGKCISQEDTGSQVSGIVWSERYREIATSHGHKKNQLSIWRYPSLQQVGELTGHTLRILSTALSPDQTTVATLGADDSLRFWKCFQDVQPKSTNKILTYSGISSDI